MADLERSGAAGVSNPDFSGTYQSQGYTYVCSFTPTAIQDFSADCLKAFDGQDRIHVRWQNHLPEMIGEHLEADQLILRRVYSTLKSQFTLEVADQPDGAETEITKDNYLRKISEEISIAPGKKEAFLGKLRGLGEGLKVFRNFDLYLPEGEYFTMAEFKLVREKLHTVSGVSLEVNTREEADELKELGGQSGVAGLRVNTEDIPEGFFTSDFFSANLQHLDLSHNQAAANVFFEQRSPHKRFSTLTLRGVELQEGWFLRGSRLVIGLKKLDLTNCDRENVTAQFSRPNHNLPVSQRNGVPRFQCLEQLKISFDPTPLERDVLSNIICADPAKVIKVVEPTSCGLTKSAAKR